MYKFNIQKGLPSDLVEKVINRIGYVNYVVFSFNDETSSVLYIGGKLEDYSFTLENQTEFNYKFDSECSDADKWFNRCYNLNTKYVPVIRNSYRKIFGRVAIMSDIYDCGYDGYYMLLMDDKNNLIIHNILNLNIEAHIEALVELNNKSISTRKGFKGFNMLKPEQIKILKGVCK